MAANNVETFDLTFVTEAYLPEGYLGLVSLRNDWADLSRVESGQVKFLDNHNRNAILGAISKVELDGDKLVATVELPEATYNKKYREQRADGLRGHTSVGYRITDMRLVDIGQTYADDKFDASWELLEISDTPVPADVDVGEGRSVITETRVDGSDDIVYNIRSTDANTGSKRVHIKRSILEAVNAEREKSRAEMEKSTMADVTEQAPESQNWFGRFASWMSSRSEDEIRELMDEEEKEYEDEEEEKAEEEMDDEEKSEDMEEDEEKAEDEDDEERSDEDSDSEKLTRAEWRRLERSERNMATKRNKSEKYGDRQIVSNPVMTLEREGFDGLTVSNLIRAQLSRNVFSHSASRELEWLERSGVYEDYPMHRAADVVGVIPFEFLSRYAPMNHTETRERQAALREIHMDQVREGRRAAITTADGSGYGTINTNVDVANSQTWLSDRAPVLEALNVVTGVQGEQKYYFDTNAAADRPQGYFVAEGGNATESTPKLSNPTKLPKVAMTYFPISSSLLAASTVNIEQVLMEGATRLLNEFVVRGVLSGPNVGANFAQVGGSIAVGQSLMTSGINFVDFGNAASDLNVEHVINTVSRLRSQTPWNDGDFKWILSTQLSSQMRQTQTATAMPWRLLSNSPGSIYTGKVRYDANEDGYDFVDSNHLGGPAVGGKAQSHQGILLDGKSSVVPMWGAGIEIILWTPPGKAQLEYGLRVHFNHIFINPRNAAGLRMVAA